MKLIVKTCGICCMFWHHWKLVKDNGYTKYYECSDCLARKAERPDGGVYQPVDLLWLREHKEY